MKLYIKILGYIHSKIGRLLRNAIQDYYEDIYNSELEDYLR
jgi:hypothetical protein